MRSYGQYCSVAKALDVIGDRWTLLIIRELLLRGACRYTDLRAGLPGIATNLLAQRLRELEQAGVLAREDAPPPIATTLFRLTARGEQLESVIDELGRWGVPLMVEPREGEEFRAHWLRFPVELFLLDSAPERPPVTLELRTGGEPVTVCTTPEGVRVCAEHVPQPDAVLSGTPQLVLGVLSGALELDAARARGLELEGDPGVLARLLPAARDVPAPLGGHIPVSGGGEAYARSAGDATAPGPYPAGR
jgi:DNA-binding HxlR family transcriptional regulator